MSLNLSPKQVWEEMELCKKEFRIYDYIKWQAILNLVLNNVSNQRLTS